MGPINDVPNFVEFEEKFEFYHDIEHIFSQLLTKLINDVNESVGNGVECSIKTALNSLIHNKNQLYVVCKIQDYQLNPLSRYDGKIHIEGLENDCIKLVFIYVIQQSQCLSPCILKIRHFGTTLQIETQQNMAIVFNNNENITHQVQMQHNNRETAQGTRKVLAFWIVDNSCRYKIDSRNKKRYYPIYNTLNSNTNVNLRFDTDLIANNWARQEFNKNDVVVNIPKNLSLLIANFICGDLEYIFHQRKNFRQLRSMFGDRQSWLEHRAQQRSNPQRNKYRKGCACAD